MGYDSLAGLIPQLALSLIVDALVLSRVLDLVEELDMGELLLAGLILEYLRCFELEEG